MMRCPLIAVFLIFSVYLIADGVQPTGSGTLASPYQISTISNLQWVSTNNTSWSKHFEQTSDIDASTTSTWNSGAGFSPIGDGTTSFTGVYDGGNHIISNLFIDRDANDQGFFGRTDGATITDLGIVGCSITGSTRTGALASLCIGSTSIQRCYSTGSVTGSSTTGGLVGFLRYSSEIHESYSTCSITSGQSTGGLVGKTNNSALIECSYSRGTVTGSSYVGGLVGENQASNVYFCYSTGLVNGSVIVGGLIGYTDNLTIINCVWDIDSSGQSTSQGGIGLNTDAMKEMDVYTSLSWDFMVETSDGTNDNWGMNGLYNDGYPFLAWQGYEHFPPAGTEPIGEGISSNPYIVSNLDNLLWASSHVESWDKFFRMASNVDATDTYLWLDGDGFRPIGNISMPFTGTFDGNEYRISNLHIDRPDDSYQGLFGVAQSAAIYDLRVTNVYINGYNRVGALIGSVTGSYVLRCRSTGDVIGYNTRIGGLIGQVGSSSEIEECSSSCSVDGLNETGGLIGRFMNSTLVSSYATGSVEGTFDGGGLIGVASNGAHVDNCYATGPVEAANGAAGLISVINDTNVSSCYCMNTVESDNVRAGGFAGIVEGTSQVSNCFNQGTINLTNIVIGGFAAQISETAVIEDCYSVCAMNGSSSEVGGFVGEIFDTPDIFNCFWDEDVSGITSSAGGTGMTTTDMQLMDTYYLAGWDFIDEFYNGSDNYWGLNASENGGYPFLSWQGYEHTTGSPEMPEGSGTEADPYLIGSAKHIIWLANSPSYWSAYFQQIATIDLSDCSTCAPIGNAETHFTGSYEGQSYLITGFSINSTDTEQGFFGVLENAQIDNVMLVEVEVIGGESSAGLVGHAITSVIDNCYVSGAVSSSDLQLGLLAGLVEGGSIIDCITTGSVDGDENTGGLIGFIDDGTVTGCSSDVDVTGTDNTGGMIGRALGYNLSREFSLVISDCFCTGSVSANTPGGFIGLGRRLDIERCSSSMDITSVSTAGGFAGSTSGAVNFTDCYSLGSITSPANLSGGFMYCPDSNNVFRRCYSACTLTNSGSGFVHAFMTPCTFNQCYWDKEFMNTESSANGTGLNTAEMKTYMTFYLKGWDMMDESDNGSEEIWGVNSADNDGYPFLSCQGYTNSNSGLPLGTGTSSDPYQIADYTHLYWLSEKTDVWNDYFVQTADIDASQLASFNDSEGMNSIGNSAGYFTGTYDGQDFVIDGLTKNRPSDYYEGLFGYIVFGTVRNIILTNCSITVDSNSGGIVGRIEEGSIEDCYVSGTVHGNALYTAGIAGFSYGSTISGCHNAANVTCDIDSGGICGWSSETTVIDCINTGTIQGLMGKGGICGHQYGAEITDCYNMGQISVNLENGGGVVGLAIDTDIKRCHNAGSISGMTYIGGLVGLGVTHTTITNCYSTGSASGTEKTGGLIGSGEDYTTIVNSFSTGLVSGDTNIGGFIGFRDNCGVQHCFYDTQTSGMSSSVGGTGKTTEEMKDIDTFLSDGWDFMGETANGTDNPWKLDGVNNSGYPLLASEDVPAVAPVAPENIIFTFDGNQVSFTWDIVPYVDGYRIYSGSAPYGIFGEETGGTFDDNSWTAPATETRRFYKLCSYIGEETRTEPVNPARKESR